MKTIVVYHKADFDGIFCREIARKFLPNAELMGWDYGDPVPTPDVVSADDRLYMLDISVEGLMGHPKLIWIDHHKSAIEKFGGTGLHDRPAGYRIDGVAACRLAWQWFTHHQQERDEVLPLPIKQEFIDRTVSEPLAVRLAGEYDIWDKRDPRAELFQHGLHSRDLTGWWEHLLQKTGRIKCTIDELERLISEGKNPQLLPDGTVQVEQSFDERIVENLLKRGEAIQFVQTEQNASIIKAYGFDVEFEGLKFLACNHARFNSHLFTAGIKPEHDALLGFNWDGPKREWRVSLYHAPGKEHHDLSLIAVKHGGGGHKGACGFRTDHLPFLT